MLSGGHEHMLPSRAVDRALIAAVGVTRPNVAVVPAAPRGRTQPVTRLRALRSWAGMGATVDVIDLDATPTPAPEVMPRALQAADIIVLTGGHPARLATATSWWPHIVTRWRQGAGLSGSSAGAMMLCEWRQLLAPPQPLRLVRGFGLLPDCVAAPHFDRPVVRRWARRVSRLHPDLTVLGLDEQTAVLRHRDRCIVHGPGSAVLLDAGRVRRYDAGQRLPHGFGAQRPVPRFPRMWQPVDVAPAATGRPAVPV